MQISLLTRSAVVAISACVLFAGSSSARPVVDPTDLDLDGEPGVAAPVAVTTPDGVSALVGTGTLLIDRSHANSFDVSGFTDFLAASGWVVAELTTGPITSAALANADVLMVPVRRPGFGSIFPFTATEVSAIQDFLAAGNGLWVLHDNVDPTGVNTLASAFGVTFRYDYIQDATNNEGEVYWPTIRLLEEHPVTNGVQSYGYYLGACLDIQPPSSVIARADADAYSFFCPAGSRPPTMAAWSGGGRALFSGDSTPLHPNYYLPRLRAEEQLLLQNIVNWLLGSQPTASSSTSWGSMKSRFAAQSE